MYYKSYILTSLGLLVNGTPSNATECTRCILLPLSNACAKRNHRNDMNNKTTTKARHEPIFVKPQTKARKTLLRPWKKKSDNYGVLLISV